MFLRQHTQLQICYYAGMAMVTPVFDLEQTLSNFLKVN